MSKTDQMRHDSAATIRATKVRSRTCNDPQHLWDWNLANIDQTETFNDDAHHEGGALPVPTKENNWLGFCPSAVKLQNGDKRVRETASRIATPRVKLTEQFIELTKEKNRLWSCLRGVWGYYLLLFTERLRLHGPRQH